jgi:hypothetical protein
MKMQECHAWPTSKNTTHINDQQNQRTPPQKTSPKIPTHDVMSISLLLKTLRLKQRLFQYGCPFQALVEYPPKTPSYLHPDDMVKA